MRQSCKLVLAACATALAFATGASAQENVSGAYAKQDPATLKLQTAFDPIGAEVHTLDRQGRAIYYIDEGSPAGRPVVFIGGLGTSLEAFQLTEFARTTRQRLGLRVISVERNGFGESGFDAKLGYADYNNEILSVLDHLGIDKFAIMAISGGGAYAAHLAAAVPERVLSLHAGAAVASTLPTRKQPDCAVTLEAMNEKSRAATANPKEWWGVPGSPVLVIPGWQTRAYADATRSFYVAGQGGDPNPLSHERMLPCGEGAVVDPKKIIAPAFLYWGADDKAVPVAEMEMWKAALPNVARATVYPGEGHTVQYRHWDQIMVDIAGYADHTVVCRDGETVLVPAAEAGDLPLGLCAWSAARQEAPK